MYRKKQTSLIRKAKKMTPTNASKRSNVFVNISYFVIIANYFTLSIFWARWWSEIKNEDKKGTPAFYS